MTKSKCLVCLDRNDPDKQFLYKPPQERITVNLIKDTLVIIDGHTLFRDEVVINYCPKCGRDINPENNTATNTWKEDSVLYVTGQEVRNTDTKYKESL